MQTLTKNQLDACWTGLAERVQRLQQLDLSDENDLECALDESQRLLGAIAHCRHLLLQVDPHRQTPCRQAA